MWGKYSNLKAFLGIPIYQNIIISFVFEMYWTRVGLYVLKYVETYRKTAVSFYFSFRHRFKNGPKSDSLGPYSINLPTHVPIDDS